MRKFFIKAKWNRVVDGNLFPFVEKKIFKDCINFDIKKKKIMAFWGYGVLNIWFTRKMVFI